jgi:tetratricopeptide (TPR) repeat protein
MHRSIFSIAGMLFANVAISLSTQQSIEGGQPAPSGAAPADVTIERLETTYQFENNGTGHILLQGRAKALTVAGRDSLGRFGMTYDPRHEKLRVDQLRTIKANGQIIPADRSQLTEGSLPSQGGLEVGYAMLPAANFETGDSIEFSATRVVTDPIAKGEFWAEHFRSPGDRIGPETVALDLPAERAVAFWYDPTTPPTVTSQNGRVVYRWSLPPPGAGGPQARPQATFAVSSFTTWGKLGDWYLRLQDAAGANATATREKATTLVASTQSSSEQAAVLYAWVSRSIRYVSLALGGNGFQPHPVDDVLAKSYGDCKDKHLLLATMLKDVGIEAVPALVSVADDLRYPSVPTPGQFDHVLTVITVGREETWVDSSLEVARFGQLLPSLRGRRALVLRSSRSGLVTIPEAPNQANTVEVRVSGSVSAGGTLSCTTEIQFCGEADLPWRLLFHSGAGEATAALGKALAQAQADGAVADHTTSSDPEAVEEPFTVRYAASKTGFINPFGTRSSSSLPSLMVWLTDTTGEPVQPSPSAQGAGSEAGAGNQAILAPTRLTETIDIAVPDGYAVEVPQAVHIRNAGLTFDATYEFVGGHLNGTRTLERKSTKEPGADRAWAALQQVVKGDTKQAAGFRRAAGSTNSEDPLARLSADELAQLGFKAVEDKQFETARATLSKAVEKDQKHLYAWNNLGRAYLGLREWQKAEAALRKQIEVNALDQWAFNNLGEALCYQLRFREAAEAYRAQLNVNPFDQFALVNLGNLLNDTYHFDEAVGVLKQARKAAGNDPRIAVHLVRALRESGHREESRELLEDLRQMPGAGAINETMVETFPTGQPGLSVRIAPFGAPDARLAAAEANRRIADARARLDGVEKPDTAFDDVATMARLAEDLDLVGQIRAKEGDTDKARRCFVEALAISLSPDVAAHLADFEAGQGRLDKALHYEAIVQRTARNPRPIPTAIEAYAEKTYKGRQDRETDTLAFSWEVRDPRRISTQLTRWPGDAEATEPVSVQVRALVAATGEVIAAEALRGAEPWRSQAIATVKKLKLPPVTAGGVPVRTSRTLDFRFDAPRRIEAVWGYGLNPWQEFWHPQTFEGSY